MTHFAPYHYSTGFNQYWYKYHLEKNGFKVLSMIPSGNYFSCLEHELTNILGIGSQYYGHTISIYQKYVIYSAAKLANKLSKQQIGESSELKCNGYFVLAKKL